MKSKKYRPSNGTEGDFFMNKFCFQCINENPDPDKKPNCKIMTASMMFNVDDKKYPKEWVYDENDSPTCTSFVKWDWDNDGDPNDSDNPKAPVIIDPNQLCLPFVTEEIEEIFSDNELVNNCYI